MFFNQSDLHRGELISFETSSIFSYFIRFFFNNDFKVFCFVLFCFATVNFLVVTKANFPGPTSTKSTFHQEDVIFHPFLGNIKFYHVQF